MILFIIMGLIVGLIPTILFGFYINQWQWWVIIGLYHVGALIGGFVEINERL